MYAPWERDAQRTIGGFLALSRDLELMVRSSPESTIGEGRCTTRLTTLGLPKTGSLFL